MSPPTLEMSSISRIDTFRDMIKDSTVILHYNRRSDTLRVWPWPSSMKARIQPSAIHDHRMSHKMLGPGCLCPMMDANGPGFVEAAIYVPTSGEHWGKYTAACAKDVCGYCVPLEQHYNKPGPVECYDRRAFGEIVPPRVTHISEARTIASASRPRPLKRSYAMLDINEDAIPQRRPPALLPSRRTADLLAKLDARERPGISQSEFQRLFYRCECGIYVTRRAFRDHDCLNEVVDLTTDN